MPDATAKIIVITGLPGAGKTTLARELASRWCLPLLAKDLIKEPLLDILGAADADESRRLSDASFAVLFDIAREMVTVGTSFLLEGNFRAGEHEAQLMRAISQAVGEARIAQVLCRVPEDERLARIQACAESAGRHTGHRFGEGASASMSASMPASTSRLASAPVSTDAFLDVPSMRLIHTGADGHPVHAALDDWMNLRAPSP